MDEYVRNDYSEYPELVHLGTTLDDHCRTTHRRYYSASWKSADATARHPRSTQHGLEYPGASMANRAIMEMIYPSTTHIHVLLVACLATTNHLPTPQTLVYL